MAGLADMARSFAAGGGDGGLAGDAGSPDLEAMDPNAPEEGPGGGGDEQLMQGISMIEGALEGLPGDLAEKARKHLEGLKEIASQAEAVETPDEQTAEANAGQEEMPPGSPSMGGSPESM